MRIVYVTSPHELRPLFEFRHRVYVDELAWLASQDGVLVDEFDDIAFNYAAYDDDAQLIGSVRVVPDGPLGLPLERCFSLNGYRDGKRVAEISRLAVTGSHRGSRLGGLLMKAAYQRCIRIGVTHIALDTYIDHDEAAPLYDRMGFVRIGDPYTDHFHLRDWPSMSLSLDVTKAELGLPTTHPGLYRFFTTVDQAIEHD